MTYQWRSHEKGHTYVPLLLVSLCTSYTLVWPSSSVFLFHSFIYNVAFTKNPQLSFKRQRNICTYTQGDFKDGVLELTNTVISDWPSYTDTSFFFLYTVRIIDALFHILCKREDTDYGDCHEKEIKTKKQKKYNVYDMMIFFFFFGLCSEHAFRIYYLFIYFEGLLPHSDKRFFYWLTDRISIVLDIILCSPSCFCLCFTVLHCPIVTS